MRHPRRASSDVQITRKVLASICAMQCARQRSCSAAFRRAAAAYGDASERLAEARSLEIAQDSVIQR